MIGIDANALTYLVEALLPGYDPENDSSDLAEERIAMLRIYFYRDEPYYVLPSVKVEYKKIPNELTRDQHESIHWILLLDYNWKLDASKLNNRKQELLKHHTEDKDCQIVAEAELAGFEILLTCDVDLRKRLESRTNNLRILTPKEYWDSLEIPRGEKPEFQPTRSNPLFYAKWWRW